MRIARTTTATLTSTLFLGTALFAGACGSSESQGESNAFLTIVGDRNVYLEAGQRQELQVRYHDGSEQPLTGVVQFSIDGDGYGAELASDSATTDSDGVATINITAGDEEQASFYIEASAPEAGTAKWNINVEADKGPLDPNGVYRVDSTYDVVSNLEGTPGTVVNNVIDFSEDPGTFLLQLAKDNVDFFPDNLDPEVVGPVLTGILESQAPQLVTDLLTLGENFGQVTRNFNITSRLTITGSAGSRQATHEMTGIVIAYAGNSEPLTMQDLGVEEIVTEGVAFSMTDDETEIGLDEHAMPMSYGSMLTIAIEEVLIPALDPTADTLAEFLANRIPCDQVGVSLAEEFDFFDASEWEQGCEIAIDIGAPALMAQLERLDDTGMQLTVAGTARPMDTDGDRVADRLLQGEWQGSIDYSGLEAELTEGDNSFTASRIDN